MLAAAPQLAKPTTGVALATHRLLALATALTADRWAQAQETVAPVAVAVAAAVVV